jgi:citrate synthase
MKSKYLTAKEVTAELDISLGTLYSYVSRGLIRSEETDGNTRHKRYWAEDVAALRNRREQRRNPTVSAATALDFGDPVLESSITLIDQGNLYYRGYDVRELARNHTAEEVAGLLWTNHLQPILAPLSDAAPAFDSFLETLLPALPPTLTPVERFQLLLPLAEAHDLAAHDKSLSSICRTASRIYALFLTALSGRAPDSDVSLAQHVTSASRVPTSQSTSQSTSGAEWVHVVDVALIFCADHELNASSFTARCVAATGATPYGAVTAALAALQGPRHGGDATRCESLIREAAANPHQTLATWLRRGERLPGFGHRLYPEGDPRGRLLLELLRQTAADPAAHIILETVDALCQEVHATFGLRPTIDMGLATLALAAGFPSGASLTLFTAGRIMGWIAHIIEQYQTDTLIRPRARYTGPQPNPG